jgi:hypothetical protein
MLNGSSHFHAKARAVNEPNLLVRHEISLLLCFPDAAGNDLERAGTALGVESHEVVPDAAESADWCLRLQATVRSVAVVAMEPSRQLVAPPRSRSSATCKGC